MQSFEAVLELVASGRYKEAVERYRTMMNCSEETARSAIEGQKAVYGSEDRIGQTKVSN